MRLALGSRFWLALILAVLAVAPARAHQAEVQTTWRLLDYIAVDYAGAVSNGKVINPAEYTEMREFSGTVADKLNTLPPKLEKRQLLAQAKKLRVAIERKAQPDEVAQLCRSLGSALLRTYPVAMAPAQAPNLQRGAKLYRENCSSCHGLTGAADTPMARQLDPPPIDFTDRSRAAERSPFALYQVIDQGLEGTAMASFSTLPVEDRWDLAFYAGSLAYSPALAKEGRRIWASDSGLRAKVSDLAALSSLSESALARDLGRRKAAAVVAFLRTNPQAATAQPTTLALAKQRLRESLAAYQAGNRREAGVLALSAYLDGFEPLEATLGARDADLMVRVEKEMGALRAAIAGGSSVHEVRARVAAINSLFDSAEMALLPDRESAVSTFAGAFTILLREGLEALLIVIAMLAFLRKADRPEMARPVHYGWVSALAAGALTWWAATELITVSGASRELTEGFGSLLAAGVLLFVGIWMHGKAQAGEWQRYIREKISQALTRRSAWFLFALAFIAVYREVFETILFYAAMAAQGQVGPLFAGALTAVALLAVIAVAMLRFSQKLPISKFFAYSSALVAVLAVVLAGKGVAALQEAGLLGVFPLEGVPRISMLGLFPTGQVVAAQLLTLVALILGFAWNRRQSLVRADQSA